MHAVGSSGTLIGGDTGVGVEVSNAANVTIRGNAIGLAPDGVTLLPNQGGLTIAGTAASALVMDNVIADNALFGISVNGGSATAIQILDNQISQNQAAGILLDGAA